jgi:hypothetical protein
MTVSPMATEVITKVNGSYTVGSARTGVGSTVGADVKVILKRVALYILYGEPPMKYTGQCDNDFNVYASSPRPCTSTTKGC